MDDLLAHGWVAFLTPLAWGMLVYPLAKRFNKDWVTLLIAALFLSLIVMIVKELGDQQVSRNDIIADMAGMFFGTAVLAALFLTGNAAANKNVCLSARLSPRSSFRSFLHNILPIKNEISLRELLLIGLNLSYFGARFYSRIAGIVKDQKAKQLCLELAQIEVRQAERVSSILNAWLPRAIRPSMVEWTQMFIYKHDLYIRKFSVDASEKEILRYAIKCEEKMKIFYSHFRHSFPESWKRMHLAELIQSEADHKVKLQDLLLATRR